MSDRPPTAHSLAEVYLYLMITSCEDCGKGPLHGRAAEPFDDDGLTGVEVRTICQTCQHRLTLRFELTPERIAASKAAPPDTVVVVNDDSDPSLIIDVSGWVTLFRIIADAAAKHDDKIEARRLGCEAAQCLDEALKFYEPDNDLPPETAFFDEASRRRHREHPQQLARSRLINLRAKLPTLDAMQKRMADTEKKTRPWWKRWG
ncbi:MAG: hypothetical protein GY778_27420 [bacterium]|nr:hypothetical protein [bacterium]